jgi:hypothetical protein
MAGEIDSSESIPGLHKLLQIRALAGKYDKYDKSIHSNKFLGSLKVPKCEILMSWIFMIFLSWSLYR